MRVATFRARSPAHGVINDCALSGLCFPPLESGKHGWVRGFGFNRSHYSCFDTAFGLLNTNGLNPTYENITSRNLLSARDVHGKIRANQ